MTVGRSLLLLIAMLFGSSCGCAVSPYRMGNTDVYYSSHGLAALTDQQIERGSPHRGLDTFGWIWGIPGKIILLNRRVENHRIDEQTEAAVAAYLADNQLTTVKVRLNQYNPRDDWRRLRANDSVGAGWRYTLGALSVLSEALFPGRLFGGDHYNPFTNTVHVYSGIPAIALHEAGHAKDFAREEWKGTYAAFYLLPGAPLFHEARATGDVLGYIELTDDVSAQQEAYEVLYPAYGTYVGSTLSSFVPYGYISGVVAGHIAGQWKSWSLDRSSAGQQSH